MVRIPREIIRYYREVYPKKLENYKNFDPETREILARSFEWHEVGLQPHELIKLVRTGILTISPLSSRRRKEYMIRDLSLIDRADELNIKREKKPLEHYFSIIVGHADVKFLIRKALSAEKPVHVLLVGPPATAKSLFLEAIYNSQEDTEFLVGPETTEAGIEKLMLEKTPKIILIDEIDKCRAQATLLTLMESGYLKRTKGDEIRELRQEVRVFAAANRIDKLTPELKSRFLILYLKEYTKQEFYEICLNYLTREEGVDVEIAKAIADKVWNLNRDVRTARYIARLISKPDELDTVIAILEKYSKK